ncbi:hypothetical protein [Azospirillum brasilense]|uniref:hypothetical protein n=1 Tax=Azospirillum brasilense TaxID=192 RepID=UPI001EDC2E5A|nr:hypothetical protein [Azospirillum brasilense]UKJ73461.1 hypothetical protein H1Q64_02260 [Azospirillum brasilense]
MSAFSGKQARELTEVTEEEFKHWRKVLSGVPALVGKRPKLRYSHLILLSVVKELTQLGLSISPIRSQIERIALEMETKPPADLKSQVLVLSGAGAALKTASSGRVQFAVDDPATVFLAMGPIIARLDGRIQGGSEPMLPF